MTIPANPDPWLPPDPGVSRDWATITISRVPDDDLTQEWEILDNVRCVFVERHEGPDPGVAGFRYVFASHGPFVDAEAPMSAEQALDDNYALPKTVSPGDRLLVQATAWDESVEFLFDGYVLDFKMNLGRDVEQVDFVALGVAKRAWDTLIPGMLMRQGSSVSTGGEDADDVRTDHVAQFNAKGRPNRTPDDAETDAGDGRLHHVFVSPDMIRKDDVRAFWTLPQAVKYLLYTCNKDEYHVRNPEPDWIDELLVSREPKTEEGVIYDPDDPETYDATDIRAVDSPLTGRDWPTTVHRMLRDKGFGMQFLLYAEEDKPATELDIYLHEAQKPKPLYLAPRGSALNPSYTNTARARVSRDFTEVANVWTVQGRPVRYECSFILAPGFPAVSSDASAASLSRWEDTAVKANPDDRDGYRKYWIDECGEGHYKVGEATKLTDAFDFDGPFGTPVDGVARWVERPRKPIGELLTKGPDGKPLKARLSYSHDYVPPIVPPEFWQGTGTWKPISGGWDLLPDRIGIRITAKNPNAWNVGADPDTGAPVVLRGVEGPNNVSGAGGGFYLRLTVVVEADECVKATADRRFRSPLTYDIERVVDARDRLQKDVVDLSSEFNQTDDYIVDRDDTDAARAEALAYRAAADAGVLSGSVLVPYLTTHYGVGDRISGLAGRGVGFRTDGGGDGATPLYPIVEGVRWDLEDGQKTTLFLSDEAPRRASIERKLR